MSVYLREDEVEGGLAAQQFVHGGEFIQPDLLLEYKGESVLFFSVRHFAALALQAHFLALPFAHHVAYLGVIAQRVAF